MKVKTLPQIVAMAKSMDIPKEKFPENVCVFIELDKEDFSKLLDEIKSFNRKGGIWKHRLRGYLEGEFAGLKIRIAQV